MYSIQTATTDAQILACWSAMHHLRPKLVKETFVAQIRAMQQQSYELLYVLDDQQVVAVAGFRYLHQLFAGRVLYIDDLATLPAAQHQGYASGLLDYIHKQAQERHLDGVALDSGLDNEVAHRLYQHKGFMKVAFHFIQRA
ncbi:GNAT family N-acetyltransferase [Hymenobacter volaticus]|uniref:GNAT family N-acetyltransferase n=1 Tax=Hymenobacter volaticus TaxID=2932254 RepID=A0ABY4GFA6_9BACT|nr:GNAT family N-acetyltransferase [Hymenobacter volaticus]UOQ69451.1 GNAT family N-acetyltransferase [Hymenobacter volaticus]